MAAIAAAIVTIVVLPVALVGAALLSLQSAAVAAGAACSNGGGPGGAPQQVGNRQWTAEQLSIAQIITVVAMQRKLPARAAVLAVATGLAESGLRNLPYGDLDSLGVFQQRPSQGWGSPANILNPTSAAGAFYNHLLTIPHWSTLPPGVAEQDVQHSAFPSRYAPQEAAAASLVAKYWTGPDNPPPPPGQNAGQPAPVNPAVAGCPNQGRSNLPVNPAQLPPGFQLPADPQTAAAVSYALAQLGKPYVWGATGPDAFDCSGLVMAAWAQAGVAISRTTTTQVHDGTPVPSLTQVQPGDLLFIPGAGGTPASPQHVGMYVGAGLVVDAYDEQHGVLLQSLTTWTPQVVAIRHIAGTTT